MHTKPSAQEGPVSKRIFDITGALALLLLSLPFWPVIALAIRLTSGGPAFFTQERIGYRGAEFRILKFSTMYPGKSIPERIILPGDERIFPVGRFLRSVHLDELPQLLNVLRGEMSLVGPRPLMVDYVQGFTELGRYKQRLDVRPGLTGLAQLRDRTWWIRSGLPSVFRLDSYYIAHHCLLLDCKILLATIGVVLRRQGV